jgi:hypothetical protein
VAAAGRVRRIVESVPGVREGGDLVLT